MKQFIQENKRMLILTALAILAGILIGFSIALAAFQNESTETGNTQGVYIAPSADIRAELTFSRCEHRIQISLDPESYVGCSRAEFSDRIPDAILSQFESNHIRFSKHIDGVCSAHYLMLMEQDSHISILKFDEDTLEMKNAATIGLSASMLEPLLRNELEEGVVFHSMEEMNAYLENAES